MVWISDADGSGITPDDVNGGRDVENGVWDDSPAVSMALPPGDCELPVLLTLEGGEKIDGVVPLGLVVDFDGPALVSVML